MHSSIQPSTSKAVKKTPPHVMQVEVSADKLAKKKKLIPKIIVTGPSEELLLNSYTDELPETKTIRDSEDYGPYTVHSRPSTVDAYKTAEGEEQ
ncbi:spermatogenesis-associated protein 33 [Elgaria multicarinata webbii]|uniref:spermatogenesis-associated protein 33 n=1 Tax=Elgaria multicarinata webbii TaxID=159646 RepID=UPI002FCD43C7